MTAVGDICLREHLIAERIQNCLLGEFELTDEVSYHSTDSVIQVSSLLRIAP